MRCEEFRALLERDGAAAGAEHPRECPTCARELARWQAVEGELAAMGEADVPPFLHERIMAHVRAAGRRAPRVPFALWRPMWAGPLLAVAVLLGLGGFGLWHLLHPELAPPATSGAVTAADASLDKSAPPVMVGNGVPIPDVVPAAREKRQAAAVVRPAAPEEEKDAGRQAVAAAPAALGMERAAEVTSRAAAEAGADEAAPALPDSPPPSDLPEAAAERGPAPAATFDARATERAAKGEAPARLAAARAVEIRCQLLDGDSVPVATLMMPEGAVPDVGTMWSVTIGEAGDVAVVDGCGVALERVALLVKKRLRELPPPGGYRLTQAPLPEY